MTNSSIVLQVQNLSLSFFMSHRYVKAVDSVSFTLHKGEMVALVGESGCGKTMTSLCCMGLQPVKSKVEGSVIYNSIDLLRFTSKQWMNYRGNKIAMIFQEPMTALNPLQSIGFQIAESGMAHGMVKQQAKEKALYLMHRVGLPRPSMMYDEYPHQLSGGQRQRVVIAMALMNDPDIIIADEPTSSLDVTIQTQIMQLLAELHKHSDTSLLLISHDMELVKESCDRMYVMYAGRMIEEGKVRDIFQHPLHPYTQGLLQAIPAAYSANQVLKDIPGVVPSIDSRCYDCCQFYERCSKQMIVCQNQIPTMHVSSEYGAEHAAACHALLR